MALSIRGMAAELGLGKSQVMRDKQDGMPMESVAAAQAWRVQHRDVARSFDGRIDRQPAATVGQSLADAADSAASPPADDDVKVTDTDEYRRARTEREQVRLARERMELDQARGQTIDASEAARLAFTNFRVLRDAVLNVPARLAPQLAAETDPFRVVQLLDNALSEALASVPSDRLLIEPDADDEPD